MLLIPVIEIKNGKCTPTTAIKVDKRSAPVDQPVDVARHWVAAGARRLHVVDLNSSQSGKDSSAAVIRSIVEACQGIPLQVSGGTLNEATVESYFDAGIEFVILGAKTTSTPHYINNLCLEFPGHVMVELDTKDGKVNAEGWSKLANHGVLEVAEHFQREGVAGILYSDKPASQARDFHMKPACALAQALTIPVILAHGPESLAELQQLCEAGSTSLAGTVLFGHNLDFVKAQKLADSPQAGSSS
ncbi:MAG: 1-(5-phosphoribosyl)-5-((5-phosphoribosylamino)methylideneamino)imidazole-4-carboxamide isomerase [Gammaproteobacteria bacterium]|nr:1-(5-phosphoribosyl)-5-((5-phosphoribosylamino)methylideneamino)imidazole-4-carboxamide isomerase [Gammaproteobacteria bacterium]MDE2345007.1 1-(5-phosphoribosyl)-5-((5-phosphoribosylamino)methylideneamino)imidazole-4-carboxamide isomerase [Gammaproteobacteria bacterium]